MIIKLSCRYCSRTFKGEGHKNQSLGRVRANLANHMKAAHPMHYKPRYPVAIKPQVIISAPEIKANPTKRIYTRKSQPQSNVNHCPRCGCNIKAVGIAMDI